MGSDRLMAWSSPYRILPGLNEEDQREARLVIELRNDLPPTRNPSSSDYRSLRQTAGQLRLANRRFVNSSQLVLGRIGALDAQVPGQVQRQLTADARTIYGDCVTVPNPSATPGAGRLIANLRSATLND